jgi:hypothetical protein
MLSSIRTARSTARCGKVRSWALSLSQMNRNLLDKALESPQSFIRLLLDFDYRPQAACAAWRTSRAVF